MSTRKVFPKAFLIGCDEKTEWMISWFLKNYFKHKNETKFVFADFGLSKRMNTNNISYRKFRPAFRLALKTLGRP